MWIKVSNLINPTKKDFTYPFDWEEVTIPVGTTVALPEEVAYDISYHLAQRILEAKGLPFFGIEHSECQAELMGLKEPTYFRWKVNSVEEVKTKSGTVKKLDIEIVKDDLVDVNEAPEIVRPEDNAKPIAKNKEEGITLD